MPALGPVSRRVLIQKLRRLGFEGPLGNKPHPFMVRGTFTLRIPNEHGTDIGVPLLRRILRNAGISVDDWNNA